ncbi:hypothetical protein P7H60_11275 [Vagococcus carniphilus]|uniref:hypothetical protein n=1 Tax=Vagococcus carniphilus TaxID=218144 RepID=UPI00288F59D1|nr:hypothetical protein [Vagococcus carniphilus]MDT2849722.1 hypothetical protein [Vagococcus carniphilus]
MKMFSDSYEQELLKQHRETYAKMLELVEQQAQKPPFIQQKDVSNYYKGISVGTLLRYERQGLKRSEPVEGGSVWYATSELDRFMLEHQK